MYPKPATGQQALLLLLATATLAIGTLAGVVTFTGHAVADFGSDPTHFVLNDGEGVMLLPEAPVVVFR